MKKTTCKFCKAPVLIINFFGERTMPVDADPVDCGHIAIVDGMAVYGLPFNVDPVTRYRSHYVSCTGDLHYRKGHP